MLAAAAAAAAHATTQRRHTHSLVGFLTTQTASLAEKKKQESLRIQEVAAAGALKHYKEKIAAEK